jgi:hypothetical protein
MKKDLGLITKFTTDCRQMERGGCSVVWNLMGEPRVWDQRVGSGLFREDSESTQEYDFVFARLLANQKVWHANDYSPSNIRLEFGGRNNIGGEFGGYTLVDKYGKIAYRKKKEEKKPAAPSSVSLVPVSGLSVSQQRDTPPKKQAFIEDDSLDNGGTSKKQRVEVDLTDDDGDRDQNGNEIATLRAQVDRIQKIVYQLLARQP